MNCTRLAPLPHFQFRIRMPIHIPNAVIGKAFLERLGGFNPTITIFVSCHEGKPIGGEAIARRALEAMGNPSLSQGYDLLTKNYHQFCQYCVTGKVDNGFTDFTFSNLEGVLQREIVMDCWRVWDGCWR